MTLEEAMQEIFYHSFVFTLRPKKCLEALKVIRKTLLDYEQLKSDYIELDNQIRKANTENGELKRLLRLAVEDFQNVEEVCAGASRCWLCPANNNCKWQRYDEAMKLIGGDNNGKAKD